MKTIPVWGTGSRYPLVWAVAVASAALTYFWLLMLLVALVSGIFLMTISKTKRMIRIGVPIFNWQFTHSEWTLAAVAWALIGGSFIGAILDGVVNGG